MTSAPNVILDMCIVQAVNKTEIGQKIRKRAIKGHWADGGGEHQLENRGKVNDLS